MNSASELGLFNCNYIAIAGDHYLVNMIKQSVYSELKGLI